MDIEKLDEVDVLFPANERESFVVRRVWSCWRLLRETMFGLRSLYFPK
jgi:hypothetical protein